MIPRARPGQRYKFRLLCRRCNSYLHTSIEQTRPLVEGAMSGLRFICECGNEAGSIDEEGYGP